VVGEGRMRPVGDFSLIEFPSMLDTISSSSSNKGADSEIEQYHTVVYVQVCAVEVARTVVVPNRKPNSSR